MLRKFVCPNTIVIYKVTTRDIILVERKATAFLKFFLNYRSPIFVLSDGTHEDPIFQIWRVIRGFKS